MYNVRTEDYDYLQRRIFSSPYGHFCTDTRSSTFQKVAPPQVFGSILAIAGIGLLTLNATLKIQPGDFLCILSAVFYAVQILFTGKAVKECDSLNIGILQLGFAGGFALVLSALFETPSLPSTLPAWIAILALGILCSACGFILQPIAQKYTTPTRTGLIFSLEPVFAALFGYWFAAEKLSMQGYAGAALVLLGIVASELLGKVNVSPQWTQKKPEHL